MTEERLREFDWLTNVPDKENQVVIVAPNEIDELIAEIRRLQAEVARLIKVYNDGLKFVAAVNAASFNDVMLYNAIRYEMGAAKAEEKRDD